MAAAATAVRTLIVDDDPDASEAIALVLQREGFETETATTVGEALVKIESGYPPSVVILDLRLPDASGSLVLRRIRRGDLPVKVAIVSGVPDLNRYPDLVRYPPDKVFSKPLDFRALVDWLRTIP